MLTRRRERGEAKTVRDVVLIETPEGEGARVLSMILLGCDALVWGLVAWLVSAAA